MRRCGRAYCLLLVCLFVTAVTAGGALAAPGGNGNKGKGHEGRGLALANGHAKHAPAAPQSPQAPAKPAAASGKSEARRSLAPKSVVPKAPAGVDRRASHLTICHLTGSGRYVVISPSVTGATTGHLPKHDDFVFTGSCSRPTEVPGPAARPPATGQHEPPSQTGAPPLASPAGDLPFTGGRALYLFLAGSGLIASGLALLRRKPTP
jgi:hypothetical protein